MNVLVDPAVSMLAAASLALLLAAAAMHKLRNHASFSGALEAYSLIPSASVVAVARLLPLLELTVAAGLLVPAARVYAALCASALMLVYAAAIAINLVRGRRDLDCGCEAFGRRRPIAPWMLPRNLLLAAVGVLAAAPRSSRALAPADALTLLGGLAVLVPLYLAADELLATRGPARSEEVST